MFFKAKEEFDTSISYCSKMYTLPYSIVFTHSDFTTHNGRVSGFVN